MTIPSSFEQFCKNLKMEYSTISTIRDRYQRITKCINLHYWNSDSIYNHSLYVGSYGRDTEIWSSDIDIIVQLPYSTYSKFDNYFSNGQSYLIQEVKNVIQTPYSRTSIRGDGQVICVNFSDGINFEVVPAFINQDGRSFIYPDTNSGGSWKKTDPRSEIEAINNLNKLTNKNLKRLCRMARAWKRNCSVDMSGILIDTLAYKFLKDYPNKDKTFVYYDWISRDFFKYLSELGKEQCKWLVPGSNRYIYEYNNFKHKAKTAHDLACEAISYESNQYYYSAKSKWREIYGKKFPD